jgi:hypothetical protein
MDGSILCPLSPPRASPPPIWLAWPLDSMGACVSECGGIVGVLGSIRTSQSPVTAESVLIAAPCLAHQGQGRTSAQSERLALHMGVSARALVVGVTSETAMVVWQGFFFQGHNRTSNQRPVTDTSVLPLLSQASNLEIQAASSQPRAAAYLAYYYHTHHHNDDHTQGYEMGRLCVCGMHSWAFFRCPHTSKPNKVHQDCKSFRPKPISLLWFCCLFPKMLT